MRALHSSPARPVRPAQPAHAQAPAPGAALNLRARPGRPLHPFTRGRLLVGSGPECRAPQHSSWNAGQDRALCSGMPHWPPGQVHTTGEHCSSGACFPYRVQMCQGRAGYASAAGACTPYSHALGRLCRRVASLHATPPACDSGISFGRCAFSLPFKAKTRDDDHKGKLAPGRHARHYRPCNHHRGRGCFHQIT